MKRRLISMLVASSAAILLTAGTATAQYNADTLLAFIRDTFNQHDKNLYDFLIKELDQYAAIFTDDQNAAEINYLLALVHEARGDKHAALAYFLKTFNLYPNSLRYDECVNDARQIITTEKAYAGKQGQLLSRLDGPVGGETPADRSYNFLNFLITLDESNLHSWTLDEAMRFIARFPEDERVETVQRWMADLYAKKGDHRQAVASYLKLEYAYPQSQLLPYARYSRGVILSKDLKENEKAAEILNRVITEYPNSEYASASLFMLAEIKEKRLKDYKGAIADYRKLIDAYPEYPRLVEALFAIAEINAGRLVDYNAAITAYNEVVTKFPTDQRGAKALEMVGDICKNKLGNYALAAEYYAKIAEAYPSYEKAPDMLLEAGSVCESKLKDYKKAIEYYEIVVAKFPNHKRAGDAKKRIERAQKAEKAVTQ
jgi:TolA-binding protein